MIRRSKLKVRPAIRKSQPASQGSTPSGNDTPSRIPSSNLKHEETNVKVVTNASEQSMTAIKPVIVASEKSVEETVSEIDNDLLNKNENKEVESMSKNDSMPTPKTPAPIARRRKLVACPMMARKRQKTSTSEPKQKTNTITKETITQSFEVRQNLSQPPDVNIIQDKLPHIENILSPSQNFSEPPHVDTIEIEESHTDFITLAPVTVSSLEAENPNVETEPQEFNSRDIFITSTDGDTVAENETETEAVLDSGTAEQFVEGPIKQNTGPLLSDIDAKSSEGTSHAEKKKVVDFVSTSKKSDSKMKRLSVTAKHRSNAMKKLKKLKEDQEDENEWPEFDQNVVSMSDLIFLNPPDKVGLTLGMNAQKEKANEEMMAKKHQQTVETAPEPEKVNAEEKDEDAALPVPQIRIADDGSVVIDEESLVMDTQKPVDPKISTVYEFGKEGTINQCSFLQRPHARTTRWSLQQTDKFYRCLCIVGAEFSLMGAMFRERSADDLRRKFKRERKKNPNRIDNALMQQHLSKWTDDMFEPKEKLDKNANADNLNAKQIIEETVN